MYYVGHESFIDLLIKKEKRKGPSYIQKGRPSNKMGHFPNPAHLCSVFVGLNGLWEIWWLHMVEDQILYPFF